MLMLILMGLLIVQSRVLRRGREIGIDV
jgi:hypothetical protein